MSIKISSRKAKGRELQYWACKKIAELFNIDFVQGDDLCPIHSRDAGLSGTDVVIRDKNIYEKFIYDVECKRTEKLNLYENINQAKTNTKDGRQWLIIHKKNNTKPVVVLDAEHFFELLKKNI